MFVQNNSNDFCKMNNNIQIIEAEKIDVTKWNKCVLQYQAPIYCNYVYLNTMADNWVGLVLNNYEAIMPICYRKKIGIQYSYNPAFIQQLGWIGKTNIDWKEVEKIILNFVIGGDIMLHHSNQCENFNTILKSNFIINLNQSYQLIYANYKTDLKKNLKKAAKQNFIYTQSNKINFAIDLYKKFYSDKINSLSTKDFSNFKKLCSILTKEKKCFVREVVNANNECLAIALLFQDNSRIYNLANSTTITGRKTEANHFLLDNILKEFSNTNLIFDFEGSDLIGVKTFYQKFGAIDEPYLHWRLHKNKFDALMNQLKKIIHL
jgi:hypothetical protein